MINVDVLVVGFGKAGKTIAMKRAAAGDKVAVVEQSPEMYGGTCINVGCVPTKRLLVEAERGTAFPQARDGRNAFIARLNAANKAMVEGKGALVIDGRATFIGPKRVRVTGGDDELVVEAGTVIINTGSAPALIEGSDLPGVYDSTAIQQLDDAPGRLVIVGAGPIAMEFATMFAEFGSRVTMLNRSASFGGQFEPEVAEAVRQRLEDLGVSVVNDAPAAKIVEGPAVVAGGREYGADAVLVAVGRRPATEGLGLEEVGIGLTERGAVAVDEHCRTSVEGVYAAGDVNGGPQFTYISFDDHRVILDDRWGSAERSTAGRVVPTTTFTHPPVATVGMTEHRARAAGHNVEVRMEKIENIAVAPRPKILGVPHGVAKFVLDADSGLILGANLFCTDSQELINLVALAIQEDIPAKRVGGMILTHPSTSEIFNALLSEG